MSNDFWVGIAVGALLISVPFVVLFLSKLVGYGWEAGRHKYLNRRKNRG